MAEECTRKDLLTQTIAEVQNVGEVQNQSTIAMYDARRGSIVIEWSVVGAMVRDSQETDLDVDTYYILAPTGVDDANASTWDNFFVPAGTIITGCTVHTHEAKVGSGTITPKIGAISLTAIGSAGVISDQDLINEQGGDDHDTPALIAADSEVTIVVAADVVTAGAFTIVLDIINGNVD